MAKNLFNSIRLKRPRTNTFDLTHDVKLSLDMGNLVPIMCMEAVPGDKFNISCESLIRMAPLVAPVMHRINVFMHYFFVPYRILWDGWEDWIMQNNDTLVHPYYALPSSSGTMLPLMDYLGYQKTGDVVRYANAFPLAAYQMIYQEYYRDQNLIADVPFKLVSGNNSGNTDLAIMRKRAWMHDYFTSALPWAQKGDSVTIPIAGFEDVQVKINSTSATDFDTASGVPVTTVDVPGEASIGGDVPLNRLYADTSSLEAQAATINDLRKAFRLQEWLEKNARAGTRYIEGVLAHFGVRSKDSRLNRPEYITGSKSPIVISEVLNTTGEDGGLPQGNMAGHAVSVTNGRQGGYFCSEHGLVMGIMSVMPVTAYQQGLPKMLTKTDQFDYFWPEFAHLGEQPVIMDEIYAATDDPSVVFGYTPRYSEYKYMPSRVAGDFKTSLDYWHLGRIFGSAPALNQEFIECNPDKRIFAVEDPDTNSLYAHVLNKVIARRPMPKFGTPMF